MTRNSSSCRCCPRSQRSFVAATFLIPLLATGGLDTAKSMSTTSYAVLFVMYLVLAYVTIFFNAALVSAAHERLTGGDPTLRSALAGAAARAGKILPWAIVSATVSVILRSLEDRAGAVGRIVLALAGAAWAVITFLVLPIIVIEGLGVGDAIKKSGALFKQTWGENLAAQAGFLDHRVSRRAPGDRDHRSRCTGRRGRARSGDRARGGLADLAGGGDGGAERHLPDRAVPLRRRRPHQVRVLLQRRPVGCIRQQAVGPAIAPPRLVRIDVDRGRLGRCGTQPSPPRTSPASTASPSGDT